MILAPKAGRWTCRILGAAHFVRKSRRVNRTLSILSPQHQVGHQPGLDKCLQVIYNSLMKRRVWKLVRVDIDVYNELSDFRFRHESYGNAIWRLLRMHEQMRKMLKSLGGELPDWSQRR